MRISKLVRNIFICSFFLLTFFSLVSARKIKPRLLPLTSIHIVDRNGFAETISNKDRLNQFQLVDFLQAQPYQKVLRIYARDSKGNVRSVVTSYHANGNPKQFLEILNGRASGLYKEWHENGLPRISAKVIGGMADITQAAELSWLFDGISQAWDEDGHNIAEINYSQGSLEGISTYYHPSGKVWKKIPYRKGLVEGVAEIYKDSGEILQQISYTNGNKHSTATRFWAPNQIASQEEYNQGRLENGQYFDKKGKLISQVEQGCGYRATFGKESINELQEYKNGILEGEVKVFTPQGNLKRIYHIKNNIKHGEEIEHHNRTIDSLINASIVNPQPKICFNWYEGKIHGPVKTWYSNGNVESQREMANNKKNGVSTIWYRDGNLMMIEEYEQDKLIRGDYFRKGERIPITQVIQGKGTATIFDEAGRLVQKVVYLNGKPDES